MSYYQLGDVSLQCAEKLLLNVLRNDLSCSCNYEALDRLITACVPDNTNRRLLLLSVIATVTSALSAPVVREGGDETFQVSSGLPSGWVGGARTALVVGFGGLLHDLSYEPNIEVVHAIDLFYDVNHSKLESHLAKLRKQCPSKQITASIALASPHELRSFDLVAITGSTLCNGTLESFLCGVRPDATVILQGQSASMHPKVFFESGIQLVLTTLKPPILLELARASRDGEQMRPLLEKQLKSICLRPKPH